MKKLLFLVFLMLFLVQSSFAQIRLSAIKVDDWVRKNFSGQGVVIGNIKFKGYPLSTLSYTGSGNVLQVQKGLILSTGNSFNVAGYNNSHNQSSTFADVMKPESDADLTKIIRDKLYDICYIEFDFVPMDNSIQFNYQFGSDEYPEYVDSPYNDVFAFIVSDESTSKNIALIPGSEVPVSINTVNHKLNQDHFRDNNIYKQVVIKRDEPLKLKKYGTFTGKVLRGIASVFTTTAPLPGDRTVIQPDAELMKKLDANLYRNLRYDGITKKLTAQTYVTPYKKYHLKIVIADVSDNIYDSGVFIEDRSLTAKKDVQQPGFTDYPDLSKVIDPNLILQGKKLEDILPAEYQKQIPEPVVQAQVTAPVNIRETPQAVREVPQTLNVTASSVSVESPSVAAIPNLVILFGFDKSEIDENEMDKLKAAMEQFKKMRQYYSLKISGHTDSKGGLQYNYALSDRRNKAVIDAVSQILGEKIRIPAVGKSYTQPVADNGTDDGRQANRRVELVFEKK
ncbi:OmpA family protein [Daejeonella sp. H1SJ63]|uniref:OmpA family protein n=1 Tax=Daejeonella sp. H1SJ63 TaxID=3034145 RepID=UPI0023ED77A6|nr:OmpA family protein [Daejeonella sp. H1SJ63]